MSLTDGSVDLASVRVAAPVPGALAARSRQSVIEALDGFDGALACWETGSAGFGRADLQSDLDVCVIARDGAAQRVLDVIEETLRAIEPDLDTWTPSVQPFGPQRFMQPADMASATIATVDVSVAEHGTHADVWREVLRPERHGRSLVMHDPDGLLAREIAARPPFDATAHRARIELEIATIRDRRVLFGAFGEKELRRSRTLDAHWIHQVMIIAPLVSLLGMRFRPLRFDFQLRYLHEELPGEIVERLVPIVEPAGGPSGVALAMGSGLAWIDELLAQIDVAQLPLHEHATQMQAAFG